MKPLQAAVKNYISTQTQRLRPEFVYSSVSFKLCAVIMIYLIFFIIQVVDIMKVNVDKVLERDAKLSELDNRAGIYIYIYIMFRHLIFAGHYDYVRVLI